MTNVKSYSRFIDTNVTLLLTVCIASSVLGFVLGVNRRTTAIAKHLDSHSNSISSSRNMKNMAAALRASVQQSDEKRIEISQRSDELLEFGNLSVKNVKISPNQKFSATSLAASGGGSVGDWLENFEFSLRNKSDKQITYVVFELQFPETEVNGPLMVYRELRIGIPPKESLDPTRSDAEPLALNVGDTTRVVLSAKHLQRIKEFILLRNFQLSEMNRVVVKILSVFFNDGMKWESGLYYRPNPVG